ncbi:CIC11C00000004396 [Sungouiella intermedia]|uniref:CIC11C00000001073 n=1 Tax=Sungouiella intermedia TaxID=45354 RepID=A0A1L0GG11_9ASCO|nr:CIC11C00000004460 [[Candida] intermedia]SGZ49807.1 CIC11C00000004499 [[Candida] intermedia]SGZ51830.1 CIC11C00000001073 [[Candida] intermedia]SGZ55205.1 CIC11C00000004396 [[Candida] intermedia]
MAELPFQVVKLLPELLPMSIRKRKKPQKLLRAKGRIFAVVFAAKRSKILCLAPFAFFRTKLGQGLDFSHELSGRSTVRS